MKPSETNPWANDEGFKKSDFTCNECSGNKTCPWAWDLYNTHGDCLAEK